MRLALHNGVSPGRFLWGIQASRVEMLAPDFRILRTLQYCDIEMGTMISSSGGQRIVGAIARLTANSAVRALSLSAFAPGFSFGNLVSPVPRCCIECLHSDDVPHSRLLWELTCVFACPVHGLRLASCCHGCRSNFTRFDRRGRWFWCRSCRKDYWSYDRSAQEAASTEEIQGALEVGRLLSGMNSEQNMLSIDGTMKSLVDFARARGAKSHSAQARLLGIPLSTYVLKGRPSILHLLRLCQTKRIPLCELFHGKWNGDTGATVADASYSPVRKWKSVTDESRDTLIASMSALSAREPPVSISAASRELDRSCSTLRKHAPGIYKDIVAKYRKFRRRAHQELTAAADGKVHQLTRSSADCPGVTQDAPIEQTRAEPLKAVG